MRDRSEWERERERGSSRKKWMKINKGFFFVPPRRHCDENKSRWEAIVHRQVFTDRPHLFDIIWLLLLLLLLLLVEHTISRTNHKSKSRCPFHIHTPSLKISPRMDPPSIVHSSHLPLMFTLSSEPAFPRSVVLGPLPVRMYVGRGCYPHIFAWKKRLTTFQHVLCKHRKIVFLRRRLRVF